MKQTTTNHMKRQLACALALLFILSVVPVTALAAVGTGWNDDCRAHRVKGDTQGSVVYGKHDWVMQSETPGASCTSRGVAVYRCSYCGASAQRETAEFGHAWGDWETTAEPTDYSCGTRVRSCQVCGAQQTEDVYPEGTLRRGDRGDAVKSLQECLICYGALTGEADGSYGPATENAVKAVQTGNGMTADGIAWPRFQALLGHSFGQWKTVTALTRTTDGVRERTCKRCGLVEKSTVEARPCFWQGEQDEAIRIMQQVMIDIGYKPGRIDGVFGPMFEKVITEWARDHAWYYEPGLLRPATVDRIIAGWLELKPSEDSIGVSGENTAVSLKLTLTQKPMFYTYPGAIMTYDYTVTNLGTEDCTLGPLFVSFTEGDAYENGERRFRYVGDINGNELKAGGANSINGQLSVSADRDIIDWIDSVHDSGIIPLNVWALGISGANAKRWYSNIETDMILVYSGDGDTDTALELSGRIADEKSLYLPGDEIKYELTLTNNTGADLHNLYLSALTADSEGVWEIMDDTLASLPAGETFTKTYSHVLEAGEISLSKDSYVFWLEAFGFTDDEKKLYAPQTPLYVNAQR